MIDVNLIGAPAFSVAAVGDDFVFTGVNRRMSAITGLFREDMVGLSPWRCLPAGMAKAVTARYRRCLDARHSIESEAFHDLPDGGRWWHVTLTPVLDDTGTASALVTVVTDITARKRAERDAREAEARMALAMDVLDGGFWHLDIATGHVEVAPKLAALLGIRAVDGMGWDTVTAGIYRGDAAVLDLGPLLRGEIDAATVEFRVDDPQGGRRWFRSRRRLLRGEAGAPERVIGAVLDITEQRRLEERYAREARTDALTGLANRRGFEASAEHFLRRGGAGGRGFGLIVIDLDRFKAINDRHGHATGDAVLRELAARMRGIVRPDDVVARLGGDEFAILVADVDHGALPRLAQRLVLAAQEPVSTPAGDLLIGVSLGVARAVVGENALSDLAERADRALYDVKLAGRGTWKCAA
jgi:diguanylate cyclase (GGDEF)-like protein/PAS domain S-box-containing protein